MRRLKLFDQLLETGLFKQASTFSLNLLKTPYYCDVISTYKPGISITPYAITKWYKKTPIINTIHSITFNEVLEDSPEEVQEQLIYHMDLFIP